MQSPARERRLGFNMQVVSPHSIFNGLNLHSNALANSHSDAVLITVVVDVIVR